MHAVLQSLADLCKDGLDGGLVSSTNQRPSTAGGALAESLPARNRAVPGREDPLKEQGLLRRNHDGEERAAQRTAPRPAQKRQVTAAQDRRAPPTGSKGARSASVLVRLKATLRKPKMPARPAAPPQTAAHAAEPHEPRPEGHAHMGAQEAVSQGMPARQGRSGRRPSASSTIAELAMASSWQTEQPEDAATSSSILSTSEGRGRRMPAEDLAERLSAGMEPPPPAPTVTEPRPLNIRGRESLKVHVEPQGSAAGALPCNEELLQGRPLERPGHQHKHPARRRHRKPKQPCSPPASTGKLLQPLM